MDATSPMVMRIQGPRLRKRILFVAEGLMVLAAVITLLAVQGPGPLRLMFFLVVAQSAIIFSIMIYLAVTITDFLRRHGVSRMRFGPRETIFRQGDPGDFLYIIISGEVEVVREEPDGEKMLARLGPGEYFGEMALVSDAPRTATLRTVTAVEVATMARMDFTSLYGYLPGLRRTVDKIMQQRRRTDS